MGLMKTNEGNFTQCRPILRPKANSKYINRKRLERAPQKQSSDTHKTSYDRVKRCRERKINIMASELVNVDVFTQNKRPLSHVGIVPDDAAGRWIFLRDLPCIPSLLHIHLHHFTLIGSQDIDVSVGLIATEFLGLKRGKQLRRRAHRIDTRSLKLTRERDEETRGNPVRKLLPQRSRPGRLESEPGTLPARRSTLSDGSDCKPAGCDCLATRGSGNERCVLLAKDIHDKRCVEITKIQRKSQRVFDTLRGEDSRTNSTSERNSRNAVLLCKGTILKAAQISSLTRMELFPTFEFQKWGSDKDYIVRLIKCAIASKRKTLIWCAVLSSCCVYLWIGAGVCREKISRSAVLQYTLVHMNFRDWMVLNATCLKCLQDIRLRLHPEPRSARQYMTNTFVLPGCCPARLGKLDLFRPLTSELQGTQYTRPVASPVELRFGGGSVNQQATGYSTELTPAYFATVHHAPLLEAAVTTDVCRFRQSQMKHTTENGGGAFILEINLFNENSYIANDVATHSSGIADEKYLYCWYYLRMFASETTDCMLAFLNACLLISHLSAVYVICIAAEFLVTTFACFGILYVTPASYPRLLSPNRVMFSSSDSFQGEIYHEEDYTKKVFKRGQSTVGAEAARRRAGELRCLEVVSADAGAESLRKAFAALIEH
ncbi:hypothetical protein PR048_017001 [Dryococelus australis]|uniref:Uncharacterized protein n=1 Tax=Dryococelus australis TaxID=614101 RepID=A0ABQ9H8A5_9NEOP|nr:hypothetical protein PR048_017001 [Dryococelus australis]